MASLVSMMVGQCGNQIGAATYAALHAERPFPGELALFDDRGRARAVLVDGEAKVVGALVRDCERGGPFSKVRVWAQSVRRCVQQVPTSLWHQDCAFVEDSGRGNNWAMGYHGTDGSGRNGIAEAALEALRWQWERCDWCSGRSGTRCPTASTSSRPRRSTASSSTCCSTRWVAACAQALHERGACERGDAASGSE